MVTLIYYLYAAILGAIFGSFSTALVHRQRSGQSMFSKRSVCPHCGRALSVIDLIPIASYLFLGGRCRHCKKSIGQQYLLIELLSVSLFISLAWLASGWLLAGLGTIPGWWLAMVGLFLVAVAVLSLCLAIYDLRWRELPNAWTLGGALLSLIMLVVAQLGNLPILWQPDVVGFPPSLVGSVLSGVVAAGFFILIIYASEKILRKPGMGMGDAKLALFMGLFLGFPGIVVALYVAFIFGAMLSLLLIAGRRKSLKESLPFGPFLIIGMISSLFIAGPIVTWYQSFLP